jgi:hypothetical protein
MKELFKSTFFITAAIVLFVVVIAGVCLLVSSFIHEKPEVLYSFAISAKGIETSIGDTNLLSNTEELMADIPAAQIEDASEIDIRIRHGMLIAHAYREDFFSVEPTDATLSLYKSLLKEGTLLGNCYAYLNYAWSAKQSEDLISCNKYLGEARYLFEELKSIILRNKTDLDNLQLKAELELSKRED